MDLSKEELFLMHVERTEIAYKYYNYELVIEDYKKAMDVYNEEWGYIDDLAAMFNMVAISYYRLEKYDKAIEMATVCLENEDYNLYPKLYMLRGMSYQKNKEYEKAIKDFEVCSEESSPSGPYLKYALIADCYYRLGKYEEAAKNYILSAENSSDSPGNIALRYGCAGDSYSKCGKLDEAKKMYDKKLEIKEDDNSYNSMAWFYYESIKDYTTALEYANKAIGYNSENPSALDTRANIYYELNELDKALADINKAIEIKEDEDYFKTQEKILKKLNET